MQNIVRAENIFRPVFVLPNIVLLMTRILLLTLIAVSFLSMDKWADDWEMQLNKNDVSVYTRAVSGSKMKEFKGVVFVKSNLEHLVSTIRKAEHHNSWMYNTSGSKLVKKVSDDDFYTYAVNEAPWPVSNRDNVTHMVVKRKSANEIVIEMTAAPTIIPEVAGVVRIKQMKGFWKFEHLGYNVIKVTQQVHAEPGGAIPAWLANSAVVDNPYNTLYGLKKWIEAGK